MARDASTTDGLEVTVSPTQTLRGAPEAQQTGGLPSISIDLRAALESPAPTGADLEIVGLLGEGGMGRVLLVRQRSLLRDVAVKTALPAAPAASYGALLAEGRIAGSLEHPAIVPVHAMGLDAGGLPVLVMKRIEGVSWDGLLADPAHPGWEGWEGDPADRLPGHLQILMAVCHALHFAHSRGVVHRDVKPQNVLIGRFGDAYLADWGVATRLGASPAGVCGTPAFLAPEMAAGGVVDARTDVYLLGATLHLVLTGQPRHGGVTTDEALEHARRSPPFAYAPEVPAELGALANRACHADRLQRPESARAFREELQRYVKHREARALAEQAIARLLELEAGPLHAELDPTQQARADRLLLEARFGLEQSLAQDAGNARAREALGRVEAIDEARRRRSAALEREARERDPEASAQRRPLALGLALAITAGIAATITVYGVESVTTDHLLYSAVVAAGLIATIGLALRRRFLANRFERDAFTAFLLGLAVLVLGRVIGLVDGAPIPAQMTRDALAQAGVMAVYAVAYFRWAGWISALFALCAAACARWPAHAIVLFGMTTTLAVAFAVLMAALGARRRGPQGAGP